VRRFASFDAVRGIWYSTSAFDLLLFAKAAPAVAAKAAPALRVQRLASHGGTLPQDRPHDLHLQLIPIVFGLMQFCSGV
jgi:hypothetical protein